MNIPFHKKYCDYYGYRKRGEDNGNIVRDNGNIVIDDIDLVGLTSKTIPTMVIKLLKPLIL